MIGNVYEVVKKLKKETNDLKDIIYRKKKMGGKDVYIIYNEPLTSSDKISDFVIRSLNNIAKSRGRKLIDLMENDLSNYKVVRFYDYDTLCKYLHRGFCIIIVSSENVGLALETKANINRSVGIPDSENTIRGPKDAFVENYQINIGLIKKRIKTNDLWIDEVNIGRYTDTQIGVLSINGVVKRELVDEVIGKLKKIDISGIINSDMVKNLIEKETKCLLPTIISTERPDVVSNALLEGKVAIVIDNSPYVLIIPGLFNDYFKTPEDFYAKNINTTFTRILKYIAFFIALLTPGIYIALITYNQEMIPTDLLINFAMQREGVPFPAFFEAFMMMISFEILREADLRVPGVSGNSLSIVGALILGEAAVNAGIVSPIMIIVISITAISSLPFTEPEMTNGLRWYRLLFMIGGSFLGIIGIVVIFIYFITKMASVKSFGKPYLMPFAPVSLVGLKDGFVQFPLKSNKKRVKYLSNNIIKQGDDEIEKN